MSERDANALKAVETYSMYSAAAGLIPVPLIDMAAVTALQIKMLAEVARAYDQKFEADRARPIIASLIGGLASTSLGYGIGNHLLKSVPLIGPVLGAFSMPPWPPRSPGRSAKCSCSISRPAARFSTSTPRRCGRTTSRTRPHASRRRSLETM